MEKTFWLCVKCDCFYLFQQFLRQDLCQESLVEVPFVDIRGTAPDENDSLRFLLAVGEGNK